MSKLEFDVSNVKCSGCVSNIQKGLTALDGVDQVDVDIPTGHVQVSGNELQRVELAQKLKELGYPEKE
ncbi:MAG: heavy-metal-associated domain-containing protein [Gammaproteobacteria bacterium]|nr:heavy-metal-associated domain-containing protein [Gammaproteobacteria bacterium]